MGGGRLTDLAPGEFQKRIFSRKEQSVRGITI